MSQQTAFIPFAPTSAPLHPCSAAFSPIISRTSFVTSPALLSRYRPSSSSRLHQTPFVIRAQAEDKKKDDSPAKPAEKTVSPQNLQDLTPLEIERLKKKEEMERIKEEKQKLLEEGGYDASKTGGNLWMGDWICVDCGFEYSRNNQTKFENLPDDYRCPQCNARKRRFAKKAGDMIASTEGTSNTPIVIFSVVGLVLMIAFGFWAAYYL